MVNSELINAWKDFFRNQDDFDPDYAVTISTITRDPISAETGIRYFYNRLNTHLNKRIPKDRHVRPKVFGYAELHVDNSIHYHLTIDTVRKFKSTKRFEDAVGCILPKCRFLKSNDFDVRDRISDGWDHYIAKFRTGFGEDKNPIIFT